MLKLTDDATHHTLDLVERCGIPTAQAERGAERLLFQVALARASAEAAVQWQTEAESYLGATLVRMKEVRSMLGDVLLAQSFQDTTGQIIRGVMQLVDDLEILFGELMALTGSTSRGVRPVAAGEPEGPVIPGVQRAATVSEQTDVDDLLSNLGM